jgi:hypothetical protein
MTSYVTAAPAALKRRAWSCAASICWSDLS